MSDEELEATLEDYRRAKWAELEDSGRDRLERELSRLLSFLDEAEELDWASEALVRFRRAKAEILREVLEDAG